MYGLEFLAKYDKGGVYFWLIFSLLSASAKIYGSGSHFAEGTFVGSCVVSGKQI